MRHSRTLPLLALALLGAAYVARVRAGEEPGTAVVEEVKAYALGEVVADFEGPGPDGKPVRLSDLAVDADRAKALVLAEGRAANEGQPVTLETKVASPDGMQVLLAPGRDQFTGREGLLAPFTAAFRHGHGEFAGEDVAPEIQLVEIVVLGMAGIAALPVDAHLDGGL